MRYLICMIGFFLFLEPPALIFSWNIEILDDDRGSSSSISIDNQDQPFIQYDSSSGYRILYKDGDQWLELAAPDTIRGVGYPNDAELDLSGGIHVTVQSLSGIWYDRWDGESWEIEVVDEGIVPSLALDKAGNPLISYAVSAADGFAFAGWNGTSWDIELVDTLPVYAYSSSMAIDSEENPRFSYYAAETGQGWILKYASRDTIDWHIETVDSGGIDRGHMNSLALDSEDNPHIAYIAWFWEVNQDSLEVWYTWKEGSEWRVEVVDKWHGFEPPGWHWEGQISLALDASNIPHISYRNEDRLYYAKRDPGTGEWSREVVDSTMGTGRYTSLAIDSSGYPHISYSANNADGLRYATIRPTSIGDDGPGGGATLPSAFALAQNYPNPFNPSTTIAVIIPESHMRSTSLIIYDIRGRRVRTLINKVLEPGKHQVIWDGKAESGENVSSGIYLYTLKNSFQTLTRKMVVLK